MKLSALCVQYVDVLHEFATVIQGFLPDRIVRDSYITLYIYIYIYTHDFLHHFYTIDRPDRSKTDQQKDL